MNRVIHEGGAGEAPPKRHPRRSQHIYISLGVGFLIFITWGIARVTLCWGRYSWFGKIVCHSQWVTFLSLVVAIVILGLLIRDLSARHAEEVGAVRFHRVKSAWRGYRSLEGGDFFHVTLSSALLIIGILSFAWFILLSPVRF